MRTDAARTVITLHGDARLVAAVGAVVTHAGQRLGMEAEAAGLSTSAMEVVREILAKLGNRPGGQEVAVQVIVEDHVGQLEVTIEHPGESFSAACAPHALSGPAKIWDNSNFESRNGTSRVVLTKRTPRR